jgi:hypothetical protein
VSSTQWTLALAHESGAPVVKVHVKFETSGLPAASFIPLAPPNTVAV